MACTVRYYAPGPPDGHNDPTEGWTDVDTVCLIQQRARSEAGDTGQVSQVYWFCILGPEEQVPLSSDEIIVNGLTFTFHGDGYLAHTLGG
jgi:hypothetical protein